MSAQETATAEIAGLEFAEVSMIDIRGTAVELAKAGSGPPLLFLHGIDGIDGATSLLHALSASFTVYAPSLPGFGGSEQRNGYDRVDDLAYFMFDLMDQLELDKPVIVGSSIGAWLAAELLTKQPACASRLILLSPLGLRTADRREQYVGDIFMIPRKELGERLQTGAPAPLQDVFNLPEGQLRRAMRNDEALSLYGWSPYMCNPKLADRLHRITCPTLVAWGAQDGLVTPAYREAWAEAMPQADTETIAGAGHRLHADAADALSTRIAAANTTLAGA